MSTKHSSKTALGIQLQNSRNNNNFSKDKNSRSAKQMVKQQPSTNYVKTLALLLDKKSHQRTKSTIDQNELHTSSSYSNYPMTQRDQAYQYSNKLLNQSEYQNQNLSKGKTFLFSIDKEHFVDQFFKLSNSRSDNDLLSSSNSRTLHEDTLNFQQKQKSRQKQNENEKVDFLDFLDDAINYHNSKQSLINIKNKHQKPHNEQLQAQLQEITIQYQILAREFNQQKQKFQSKLAQYHQNNQQQEQKISYLQDLLAMQKIENQNSLIALNKVLTRFVILFLQYIDRCKCQKNTFDLQSNASFQKTHFNTKEFLTLENNDFENQQSDSFQDPMQMTSNFKGNQFFAQQYQPSSDSQ